MNEFGVLLRLDSDIRGQKLYETALASAKNATDRFGKSAGKIVGVSNQKMTNSFNKTGEVIGQKFTGQFTTAEGKIVNASSVIDKKGIRPLTATVKNLGSQSNKTSGIMGDFTRSLKRVIIVVPLWAALRAAMQLVFTTFKEGTKAIREFDKEMLRAKAVISGSTAEIDKNLGSLRKQIEGLSVETGESLGDLAYTFSRFGTIGLDFETSVGGMNAALDASIAFQGDVKEIAETLALTYQFLGDSMDKTLSPAQKQELIMAKLFSLYKDNKFEIDDMNGSVSKFLPTAKQFNFTMDETIAYLAALNSAALNSTEGGRRLRSSFAKLAGNLDQVASKLGVTVNPELERTPEIFLKILRRIREINKTAGATPIESIQAIKDIFGGIRGGEPVRALVALLEKLESNMGKVDNTTEKTRRTLDDYRKRVGEVSDGVDRLSKRNENLKGLIGRAFLQGILGADNYSSALKKLNRILEDSVDNTDAFGRALSATARGNFLAPAVAYFDEVARKARKAGRTTEYFREVFTKSMDTTEIANALSQIADPKVIKELEKAGDSVENLKIALENRLRTAKGKNEAELEIKANINKNQIEQEITDKVNGINPELRELPIDVKLQLDEIDAQMKNLEGNYGDLRKAEIALNSFVDARVDAFNEANKGNEELLKNINKQQILTMALKGDMKGIYNLTQQNILSNDDLVKLYKLAKDYKGEERDLQKEIIDLNINQELERAKSRGESEIQIAKRKVELLRTQKGLNKDDLELQKAIYELENKRLQLVADRVNDLKGSTQDAIKIGLEEGDIDSFLEKFREGFRDTILESISSGLTNALFNITDLGNIMGGVFQTAEQQLPMKISNAFEIGGTSVADKIKQALGGGIGGTGSVGGIGGQSGALAGINGVEKAVEKGTEKGQEKQAGGGFNLNKALGLGLLAFGLFGSGKSSSNMSQKYQTADQFSGTSTGSATTRSTTRAKITNVTVNNNFDLNGASLRDEQVIRDFGDAVKVAMDRMMKKLAEEGIASGNY